MSKKKEPSIKELVERSLAAYQKAQESHDSLFGPSCPYNFFPGPWTFRPENVGLTRVEFEAEYPPLRRGAGA